MAVNKVVYGGETLIDLTGDSVTPETLTEGVTAHSANGEQITGTMKSDSGSGIVDTNIATKCSEFSALMKGTDKVESFIFFTDPHTIAEENGWEDEFRQFIKTLKTYYDATPTDFVLCGGDWLELHSRTEACFRLGYVDGIMRSTFDRYYPAAGNHDHNSNTSGVTYPGSDDIGVLPVNTVRNLLMRKYEKTYYSFDGTNTKFYVLDSGPIWWNMTDYMWEQVAWLGNALKSDNVKNSAILVHAVHEADTEGTLVVQPFMSNVLALCEAYNNAATITLNEIEYDFSGCTGRMRFVLCGHKHRDHNDIVRGIPVIMTDNMGHLSTETFDLCLVDYDSNVLNMVRVGSGANRKITLSEYTDAKYTNLVPASLGDDGITVYNAPYGYMNGYVLSHSGGAVSNANSTNCVATGYIPLPSVYTPIYIKGSNWNTESYVRFAVYSAFGAAPISYQQGNGDGNKIFTVEQLGNEYYKITPNSPWANDKKYYYRLSLWGNVDSTSGEELIVTHGEPIDDSANDATNEPITFVLHADNEGIGLLYEQVPYFMVAVSTVNTGVPYKRVSGPTPSETHYAIEIPYGCTKVNVTCPGLMVAVKEIFLNEGVACIDYNYGTSWLDSGSEYEFKAHSYCFFKFKAIDNSALPSDYDTSGINIAFS